MVTATKPSKNGMAKKESSKSTTAKRGGRSKGKSAQANKANSAVQQLVEQNAGLKNTLQQIEKQFGEGAIMPLGSRPEMKIEGIATGSLSLDVALGGMGIPRGRIAEVYGPESSGKTTLALHVGCAKLKKLTASPPLSTRNMLWILRWAKKIGVELDSLLVSQPNSGEEAMQITEMLVKSQMPSTSSLMDSVAALIPKQELDGEIGDTHVGLQARLMSQSMRKLTGAIARSSKASVIFINQIREKIGVMFGSPETTPGGRALKFYSSVRIDVRRIGQLKDGDEVVGQRVRTKVVKNKVAPPFRVAEFDMMHTNGISYEGDVLDLGVEHGIVTKSGAWFRYGETHLGQGKEKARAFLSENRDTLTEIKDKVMEAGGFIDLASATAAGEGVNEEGDE